MKKWLLWGGVFLCLCAVAAAVLAFLYFGRNPNVGLRLVDRELSAGLQAAAEDAGLKVVAVPVDAKAPGEDCAAVVVQLSDLAEAEAYSQAAAAPVIFVDRKPAAQDACYIGGDAYQAGQLQGQMLLTCSDHGDWNGDGVVTCLLLGAEAGQADMQSWLAGVEQALNEVGLEAEFIFPDGSVFDREVAQLYCAKVLANYGKDLEAVLACWDSATLGAMDALTQGGRIAGMNISLVGAGYSQELKAQAEAGALCGYCYLDAQALYDGVIQAVQAVRDGKTPESLVLEYQLVCAQ